MDDLNKFREDWLRELNNKSDTLNKINEKINICQHKYCQCQCEKSKYESPAFQLAHSLLRGENITDGDLCRVYKRQIYQDINSDCTVKKKKTLVDTLIKDLDEINEIPFFDISLPREIALKIFFHLDVTDLCRCAQVSHSWKNLAEDELLWYKICYKLGFQQKINITEIKAWKKEVTDAIKREKKIRSNWKNRIGRLYDMEDVRSGILCAANSFQEYIIAGYSTGKVCMWDFRSDAKQEKKTIFDPFNPQSNEMNNNEKNSVCCLAITPEIIALGYELGQAYIISNQNDLTLLKSYIFSSPVTSVVTDYICKAVGICSSNKCIVIDTHSGNCNFQKSFNYSTKVNYLSFIPSPYDITTILACDNALYLQKLLHSENEALIIHHLIGSFVTCLDVSNDLIAIGLTSRTGYNVYQVSLFTTDNGRLFGVLSNHLGEILCLSLRKSPDNLVATGCRDKRVRIFDLRTLQPEINISAHSYGVTSVQMDSYHIVTGGDEGLVCIWDVRTKSKLWEMYNRHPVKYLCCEPTTLVTANIPTNKNPEPDDGEIVVHKQQRGSLRMYDFSADQVTKDIPSICLSSYDEPAGYNYNIRLAMPYDEIE